MGVLDKLVRRAKRELKQERKRERELNPIPNTAALKGRAEVLAGKRPPLKHAICLVLGNEYMTADEVVKHLEEKRWLPAGANPRGNVAGVLSGQTKLFPRIQRGIYRRADEWEELLGPMPSTRVKAPLIDLDDPTIPKIWRIAFMLEANPVLDYQTTAQMLYGNLDSKMARIRVNSHMSSLRKLGIVQSTGARVFKIDLELLVEKSGFHVHRGVISRSIQTHSSPSSPNCG